MLSDLRTIYFRVDQSLSTWSKDKDHDTAGANVKVKIDYAQSDGQFNNKLFESDAKAGINQLLSGKISDFIKNSTVDVQV